MKTLILPTIKYWIPLAIGITLIFFFLYLSIQQTIRIGGNDPQIQMAEDVAASLSRGEKSTVSGTIDVSKSLAPFTILYDTNGTVVASNAFLNGKTPSLPKGVLTGHKGTEIPNENRITWQPQEGVRLATVIVSYANGYVLVGRNMREIEIQESQQFFLIHVGWIASILVSFCSVVLLEYILGKKKERK